MNAQWKDILEYIHEGEGPETEEHYASLERLIDELIPKDNPHAQAVAKRVMGIKKRIVIANQRDLNRCWYRKLKRVRNPA